VVKHNSHSTKRVGIIGYILFDFFINLAIWLSSLIPLDCTLCTIAVPPAPTLLISP